eukprot:1225472-Prymnesium_polylepis.1
MDSDDDEVQPGVEPENTTRKLNSLKKLIAEQDPLMTEEEITNLDLKSATDSNKKYLLEGDAYTAEGLVNWCMQHGKGVVKNLKQKQASSSDVWE